MEGGLQITKWSEWMHINQLGHLMREFHEELNSPYEDYDLFTLLAMEYEQEVEPFMLHMMWTHRLISTSSIQLN